MHGVSIVALVFGLPILALALVCGTFLFAIRLIKGRGAGGDPKQEAEEARMIQEIHQGLSRMEERVDALETILLDRSKKDIET